MKYRLGVLSVEDAEILKRHTWGRASSPNDAQRRLGIYGDAYARTQDGEYPAIVEQMRERNIRVEARRNG